MAKCKYCNREMLTADGCGCTAYLVHGKKYPRIKVGDWQDYADRWYWSTNDDFKSKYRCGDCGANGDSSIILVATWRCARSAADKPFPADVWMRQPS